MCLATVVTPGGELRPETCRIAALNNPDGFGYAYKGVDIDGHDRVFIRKALSYVELETRFWDDYDRFGKDSTFLVHWRLGTHGLMNSTNSHPYRLANGGALIHNGILDIPAIPSEWSDTRWFVRSMLNKLPDNWQRSPVWVDVVHEYIGTYNKIAGLWPNDEILIVNENGGEWTNGTWHSNDSGQRMHPYASMVSDWEAQAGFDAEYVHGLRKPRYVLSNSESWGSKECYDKGLRNSTLSPGYVVPGTALTIVPHDDNDAVHEYSEWQKANDALLEEMEEEEGVLEYDNR